MTDLEQRVAELEAVVERLTHPVVCETFPELSEADLAHFKAEFEASADEPLRLYAPPRIFDPEMVRVWLRECVTVVKPGETLVVQVPMDTRPIHVAELHQLLNAIAEDRDYGFGILVVPGDGMGVAETQ